MFGHLPELVIIVVIGLIVFGPEKLPEVAANAGRMMREVRQAMDTALNPDEHEEPDDFSAYYYESLARSGEVVPPAPDDPDLTGMWPGVAGTEGVEMAMPAHEYDSPDTAHALAEEDSGAHPVEPEHASPGEPPVAE